MQYNIIASEKQRCDIVRWYVLERQCAFQSFALDIHKLCDPC
jgi:hypothetical protein